MRLDRPQINSCQVFDKIKVDLAVSPLKKINGKDKCAKNWRYISRSKSLHLQIAAAWSDV